MDAVRKKDAFTVRASVLWRNALLIKVWTFAVCARNILVKT
jgi:hypothetical protein